MGIGTPSSIRPFTSRFTHSGQSRGTEWGRALIRRAATSRTADNLPSAISSGAPTALATLMGLAAMMVINHDGDLSTPQVGGTLLALVIVTAFTRLLYLLARTANRAAWSAVQSDPRRTDPTTH